MTEDLENKKEGMYAGQNEVSREGYKPAENTNYRNGERPMRPRIKVQRAYSSSRNYNNDSAGFRPEGFGAALQSDGGQQRSYRPRYNSGQQGGYQQRQGYQPQQRGGYRPRYNSDADGNYQPRQNQYGQRQSSPYRQNYNQGMDGGYQPRQSAGYRPRYNNGGGEGGYQPRQNSYQRGGYQRGG